METICLEHGYDERYVKMAKAQDVRFYARACGCVVNLRVSQKRMWSPGVRALAGSVTHNIIGLYNPCNT